MMLLVNGATATMRSLLPHSHLGVLLSPGCGNTQWWQPGTPWAVDNGAFSGFNEAKWIAMLDRLTPDADCRFVVAPDRVGDAASTRLLFERFAYRIRDRGFPIAYVLQDGQKWEQVPWEECAAIFVGGTTAFKTSHEAVRLMAEVKARGKWLHMGRVNTIPRIRFACANACDSADGSQFSWYSQTYLPQFLEVLRWLTTQQQRLAFD